MSALLLLLTTALLAGSAALIVAALRVTGTVSFLLAAYLIASAELIALVAVLSPAHLVRRGWVVAGIGALFAGSFAAWRLTGGQPFPRGGIARLRAALRDPPLAFLACAVALAFAYLTALALWTPPNSFDSIWYHLPRAALWKQQHAVGYIPDAHELRLNVSPPVSEIALLYTMVVAAGDRFVGAVSLVAYCAAALAVYGLGRRLGLDARLSLLGALVFTTFSDVLLQASGALNDVVLTSFLAAATYFLLGRRLVELALGGLALAFALGTKFTAPLMVPFVVGAALLAQPRLRRRTVVLVTAFALVLGSAWYVVNLVETGSLEGDLGGHPGNDPGRVTRRGVVRPLASTARYLLAFGEAPGAGGWWAAAYVAVALVVLALLVLVSRGRIAALVAVTPLIILLLAPTALRGYQWILFHLGREDLGVYDYQRDVTASSAIGSYYGPLGLLLLAAAVAAPWLVARRAMPRVALVLVWSVPVFALLLSLTLGYNSTVGRYFMFPVALAAACTGFFVRGRAAVWSVALVAGVTVLLTLRANNEKPTSVWGQPRWEVQTRVAPVGGERAVVRFADESIPQRARVGLVLRSNDWSYAFFGPRLDRTIRFVPDGGMPGPGLDWLVVAPTRSVGLEGWAPALSTADGWRVYRRSA
jgi:hypothetical protein